MDRQTDTEIASLTWQCPLDVSRMGELRWFKVRDSESVNLYLALGKSMWGGPSEEAKKQESELCNFN